MSDQPSDRLDSWKEIAAFLRRGVTTVRRWEALGLPVHRVPGGAGRSVYAYKAEVDAWLATQSEAARAGDEPPARERRLPLSRWHAMAAATVIVAIAAAAAWRVWSPKLSASSLRIAATDAEVVALDAHGARRWTYTFPREYRTELIRGGVPVQVLDGRDPAVYVATALRLKKTDDTLEAGSLLSFDLAGRLERTFSFDDSATYGGMKYAPPWVVTAFDVDDTGGERRIAVAAHHMHWFPSVLTILDDHWRRQATFIHAGWIEAAHWLGASRLLIGGFSESRDGGMVGLLDPDALNGQGPEAPGTKYNCGTCGATTGLRMVVMPRTEVNRASASRFNRAVVQLVGDRVVAHTIEVPSDGREGVDAVYEFTRSLDLVSARFSDRYWDFHRALEAQGKLNHSREQCPDRDGPRTLLVWTPAGGWATQKIR